MWHLIREETLTQTENALIIHNWYDDVTDVTWPVDHCDCHRVILLRQTCVPSSSSAMPHRWCALFGWDGCQITIWNCFRRRIWMKTISNSRRRRKKTLWTPSTISIRTHYTQQWSGYISQAPLNWHRSNWMFVHCSFMKNELILLYNDTCCPLLDATGNFYVWLFGFGFFFQ